MGKSLGNAIYLADSPEEVVRKVKSAVTDTSRIKASDPGHPEVCVVNKYHQMIMISMRLKERLKYSKNALIMQKVTQISLQLNYKED